MDKKTLPKFKSIILCPKCGTNTTYLARKFIPWYGYENEGFEMLQVNCMCGFIWYEHCFDADSEEPSSG